MDKFIEENKSDEISVPKFLVELENPKLNKEYDSNQGTHELKIKELESKAKEFKEDEEEKKIESSFFKRIFGNKKNKDEEKMSSIVKKNVGVFDELEKGELENMEGERSLFDSKRISDGSKTKLNKNIEECTEESDEISSKTTDDELLQIPAFLRRQAN